MPAPTFTDRDDDEDEEEVVHIFNHIYILVPGTIASNDDTSDSESNISSNKIRYILLGIYINTIIIKSLHILYLYN